MIDGFKTELENRGKALMEARVELESCYAVRIDDDEINKEEHAEYKTRCMKATRSADSVWTSLAGSIKSVRAVVESRHK